LKTLMTCTKRGDTALCDATLSDDGSISVSPQGGGFVFAKFPNREAFDKEFIEKEPDRTLRRGTVTAEFLPEGVALHCYTNGLRWNGFGMPMFEKSQLSLVMDHINRELPLGHPESLKWDGDKLMEYDGNEQEYLPCTVTTEMFDGTALQVWHIGDGWCWDSVDVAPAFFSINPRTDVYQDSAAFSQLELLWGRAFDDDAIGHVTALFPGESWKKLKWTDFKMVTSAEAVLLDSGNSSGDVWKYTYYPRTRVGIFLLETADPS